MAVVTGAASGIGAAIASRLADDGAHVVLADVNEASGTERRIGDAGGQATTVCCDVASELSVAELAARVAELGGADIVVSNAGIAPFVPFDKITVPDWERVMSINLESMFLVIRALVPAMRERRWGRIICMSSGTFHLGSRGQAHYVASKGGVIGLVRALATEFGPEGITVNGLAPGLIRTEGTMAGPQEGMGLFESVVQRQAIKRVGLPEDLAAAAGFLASEEASFITGQTILVDGGLARA